MLIAKTIICTARSAPSEEKKAEVQRLERETGSQILLRQADVTSLNDMNVIKDELESLPAVAGIVFTAMVLADQLLINADLATCKKVVQTKVKGNFFIGLISSCNSDFRRKIFDIIYKSSVALKFIFVIVNWFHKGKCIS